MSKLATCRVCGATVSTDAKACPHCGEPEPGVGAGMHVGNNIANMIAKIFVVLVILALGVGGCIWLDAAYGTEKATHATHKVTRVIDGDTVEIKIEWADFARTERVRLLGMDRPEKKARCGSSGGLAR